MLYEEAMLGYRKGVMSLRLAIPPRNARKPMGDVADLDVQRGGVE